MKSPETGQAWEDIGCAAVKGAVTGGASAVIGGVAAGVAGTATSALAATSAGAALAATAGGAVMIAAAPWLLLQWQYSLSLGVCLINSK